MAAASQPDNTILFLNLPQKTFVGINLTSFNSSPNFHGIINIPTGLHFLYTGTDATLSIRHGQWLRFRPKAASPQIHILRWNTDNESLDLVNPDEHTAIAAVNAIPSLRNRGLIDYIALQEASSALQRSQTNNATLNPSTTKSQSDDSEADPWPALTSHISSRTLHRILSPSSSSAANITSDQNWTISSVSSSPQDAESIPGLTHAESSSVFESATSTPTLNVLPINLKQTWPTNSVGRDRTEKARDRSWYLSHLIDTLPGGGATDDDIPTTITPTSTGSSPAIQDTTRQTNARELLAELQFSFLMVLTLANYSCLEQWKRILSVVLTCESALVEVEGYFVQVLQILRAQLGRVEDVEGGLFELGDEVGSQWLRNLLQRFRKGVDEAFPVYDAVEGTAGGKQEKRRESLLKKELVALEAWLREEYGWDNYDDGKILRRGMVDLEDGERVEVQIEGVDEEEESGEYAPVVVEM